jgi:hypothetical protein
MRKLRWLVLGAAAALLVNAGSAAAAPPNFTPAEKLCAAQGGLFSEISIVYGCLTNQPPFSERDLRVASRLCGSAYKGTFLVLAAGRVYECLLPSS